MYRVGVRACVLVFIVFIVFFVFFLFPPFRFRVNSQDRATNGVLDLIIWYQQLLVTADLTPHPSNFVSKKFPQK